MSHSTFERRIYELPLPPFPGSPPSADDACFLRPKTSLFSGSEGRVDGAQLDVGVDHRRIGVLGLDVLRVTIGRVAPATGNPWVGGRGVGREVAVEPVHRDGTTERLSRQQFILKGVFYFFSSFFWAGGPLLLYK